MDHVAGAPRAVPDVDDETSRRIDPQGTEYKMQRHIIILSCIEKNPQH